jgi:hypothetical protein
MHMLSTRTRRFLIGLGFGLAVLPTIACGTTSTGSTMQHSERLVENPDGSTSWFVQNAPAYEPPSTGPELTAPCMSCLIGSGSNTGPAIGVGGGAPVPNAAACRQNPTLVGCPAR